MVKNERIKDRDIAVRNEYSNYLNRKGVNNEKMTEFINLKKEKPTNIIEAKLLAEAIGMPEHMASVVAAQWKLESAGGTRVGGDNNYFGIKAHSPEVRKRISDYYGITATEGELKDTKEVEGGETKSKKSTFMNFKNPVEAFMGYKAFIETNPRYAEALEATNSLDYAKSLHKSGYATDPQYVNKLKPFITQLGGDGLWGELEDYKEKQIQTVKEEEEDLSRFMTDTSKEEKNTGISQDEIQQAVKEALLEQERQKDESRSNLLAESNKKKEEAEKLEAVLAMFNNDEATPSEMYNQARRSRQDQGEYIYQYQQMPIQEGLQGIEGFGIA